MPPFFHLIYASKSHLTQMFIVHPVRWYKMGGERSVEGNITELSFEQGK